jgi:hypothetical protein
MNLCLDILGFLGFFDFLGFLDILGFLGHLDILDFLDILGFLEFLDILGFLGYLVSWPLSMIHPFLSYVRFFSFTFLSHIFFLLSRLSSLLSHFWLFVSDFE